MAAKKHITARELKVLERAFAAEIIGGRFQSKSKLAVALVKKGLLFVAEEQDGAFHCEWLELTDAGRLYYCASCEDAPDSDDEP